MILIAGASGQLGAAIREAASLRGIPFAAMDRDALDIADPREVARVCDPKLFDCIVNAAAYTAVDAAVPEDVRVCHFPRIRVKPYWPQPPYWLKAFREALSPASIDTLLRGETDVDLVLNLVYGQDGRIRCLTFRIFGHAWGGVPPEELARLDRAIRENIFYYDKLEGGGRLPERYYLSHFLGVSVKRLFARHENPFFR